jgi:hypothetical protein
MVNNQATAAFNDQLTQKPETCVADCTKPSLHSTIIKTIKCLQSS